jgi:hypothetical protein
MAETKPRGKCHTCGRRARSDKCQVCRGRKRPEFRCRACNTRNTTNHVDKLCNPCRKAGALFGGRWVTVKGVARWVPDEKENVA